MRTRPAFALAALAALLVTPALVPAAQSTPPATESGTAPAGDRLPPERVTTRVIKAIKATDGDARFRAYVVEWKGQEVIASDALARTDYKEGDTIVILAMNHPFPQNRETHRLLAFTVIPPRP